VQVPVNEAIGLTFARILRAFLRQDPDRIMVGETRDLETAQISIQASLTGHLVFTTLHTNDAPGAVTRLIDMGVEPFLI
jgi:type IV pilus assembly protein PilB